jgi:hypothetical protein
VIATIDAGQLAEVVWVSLLAGVGITAAFSLVVFGAGKSAEARRAGHSAAATAYASLAVAMFALFAVTVVLGVHIMLSKS